MKPVTLAEAIQNVMKTFPGTTFYEEGTHNVPLIKRLLDAPITKRRRRKKT